MNKDAVGVSPSGDSKPLSRPLPGARSALVLLLLINLFNYVDRYVLAELVPEIRKALLPAPTSQEGAGSQETHSLWQSFPGLIRGIAGQEGGISFDQVLREHSETAMGGLVPAFLVSYILLSPVFGWLGDRTSRWWLIGVGVILWSLASGGSGLASTFLILFLTRCLIGVGEAAYAPVAPTIISDLYPVAVRGRVMAWFYSAIPVGSALGYALGGLVVQKLKWNWPWAFYLVVPPGILLGLLCFVMREPRRGQAEVGMVAHSGRARFKDYIELFRIKSYLFNNLGMTAMTFAFGGLAFWMPTYLKEERRVPPERLDLIAQAIAAHGLALPGSLSSIVPQAAVALEVAAFDASRPPTLLGIDSGTAFGGLTALAGLAATLLGGWLGDRLRNRYSGSYFLVSGVTMLLGFPLVLLVLRTPFPWNWLVIFCTVFFLFFNTGPTNTILANVTHPAVRARAFALNILIIHVLGDVISPPIIGFVKDATKTAQYPDGRLAPGFVLVSMMILFGGLFWLWGARYLEEDTKLAPTRLPSGASDIRP